METTTRLICCPAQSMGEIPDATVDLVVTSPPYPMVAMWDEIFTRQDERIGEHLSGGHGAGAFKLMHGILDGAWAECDRVMRPGGIACINIGDATRTVDGDFQLYSNHARILSSFLSLGFAALPDILWHKPTNAPNKFMGSGMLPVGAYVTYEHEYILVLRKGRRREFTTAAEKSRRRESAFFWEERNIWFSDIWSDITGTGQGLVDAVTRGRSAAFPFELAYRLICMFSIKDDVVLDPFAGTGTTLAAAMASARNSVGVELDETLLPTMREGLRAVPHVANEYSRARLARHVEWAAARVAEKGPLKHTNGPYNFPVMTAQERELLINDVMAVHDSADSMTLAAQYSESPQAELVQTGEVDSLPPPENVPRSGSRRGKRKTAAPADPLQTQLPL
jgi:modification methylase